MDKEELLDIARNRMSHAEVLEELRDSPELPDLALGLATLRAGEFAPDFLALIDAAVEGTLAEGDEMLLFYGLHVLGGSRDRRAFAPLVRLLRLPGDRLDHLLGDAITETLPRVVAGVFEDGPEGTDALCGLLADPSVERFVRHGLFGTLAFLTWEARIGRDATIAFLRRFDDQRLAEADHPAWTAWADAIALLGLRELFERVASACADGRIPLEFGDYEDFLAVLAKAEAAPSDGERFADERLGYIEDVLDAVSWVAPPRQADEAEEPILLFPPPTFEPVHDPWRHVGRNDPCPCGSGKKAKRCCLQR